MTRDSSGAHLRDHVQPFGMSRVGPNRADGVDLCMPREGSGGSGRLRDDPREALPILGVFETLEFVKHLFVAFVWRSGECSSLRRPNAHTHWPGHASALWTSIDLGGSIDI